MTPTLTLHALPPSHPCMTVVGALDYKGLAYERIDFSPGEHVEKMQAIYGEGNSTVPGMLIDGEPVHGSRGAPAVGCAALPPRGDGHVRRARPARRTRHRLRDQVRARLLALPQDLGRP